MAGGAPGLQGRLVPGGSLPCLPSRQLASRPRPAPLPRLLPPLTRRPQLSNIVQSVGCTGPLAGGWPRGAAGQARARTLPPPRAVALPAHPAPPWP